MSDKYNGTPSYPSSVLLTHISLSLGKVASDAIKGTDSNLKFVTRELGPSSHRVPYEIAQLDADTTIIRNPNITAICKDFGDNRVLLILPTPDSGLRTIGIEGSELEIEVSQGRHLGDEKNPKSTYIMADIGQMAPFKDSNNSILPAIVASFKALLGTMEVKHLILFSSVENPPVLDAIMRLTSLVRAKLEVCPDSDSGFSALKRVVHA